MSELKIQRMINEMWDLEGSYSTSAIGFNRQLVLDVYRRGDVQMYQRMWLDHGNLSELWRVEGEASTGGAATTSAGGGGGVGVASSSAQGGASLEGGQRGAGDVAWWQRMVGLLVTRMEPSPDSSLALLDFESLPFVDEVRESAVLGMNENHIGYEFCVDESKETCMSLIKRGHYNLDSLPQN